MSSKSKKAKKAKAKDTKNKKPKTPKAKMKTAKSNTKKKVSKKKKDKTKQKEKEKEKENKKDTKLNVKKKKHQRLRSKSTHEILSPKNKKKRKQKQKRASLHAKDDTTIIHHTKVLVAHRESLMYKQDEAEIGKLKRGVTLPKDIDNKANGSIIAKKGKIAKLHKEEQNALDGIRRQQQQQHSEHVNNYIPQTQTPQSLDFKFESFQPTEITQKDEHSDVDDEKVQKQSVHIKWNDDQNKNEEIDRLNKEKQDLEQKVNDLKHELSTMTGIIAKDKNLSETLDTLQTKVHGLNEQLTKQTAITNQIMSELAESKAQYKYIRVPRNNKSVSIRVTGGTSGGCCSSWWGKKPVEYNMDTQPLIGDTQN